MAMNLFGPSLDELQRKMHQESSLRRQKLAAEMAQGQTGRQGLMTGLNMAAMALGEHLGGGTGVPEGMEEKIATQEALSAEMANLPMMDFTQKYQFAQKLMEGGEMQGALTVIGMADKEKQALWDAQAAAASGNELGTFGKAMRDASMLKNRCDLNDPDPEKATACSLASWETVMEWKRETVDESGRKDQLDEWAKTNTKRLEASQATISNAGSQLRNMDRIISQIDNAYQGPISRIILPIQQVLSMFGMADAAPEEFIQSGFAGMQLDASSALKGVQSDSDMRRVDNSMAQLSNTIEGNKMIIAMVKSEMEYQRKVAQEFPRWHAEQTRLNGGIPPNPAAFDVYIEEWKKTNGYTVPTQAEIDAAINGTPIERKVGASATPTEEPQVSSQPQEIGEGVFIDENGNILEPQ
jgi:hypothetical protein